MEKEDLEKEFDKSSYSVGFPNDRHDVIHKEAFIQICDKFIKDIKSRTCENCEYYIHTLEEWSCSNVKSILYTYEYALERDETCTKFKRKENQCQNT